MRQETIILLICLIILDLIELVTSTDYCTNGHVCPTPQKCCQASCCLPDGYEHHYKTFRWSVWNMWYFWFVMIFILMSCFGGCGYWRRRQLLLAQQHHAMMHSAGYNDLFNRRLRSLRNAATANQNTRQNPSGALHTGYDTSFPSITSSYSRNDMPSNGGLPEGNFPEPPPYSEYAKEGEFSSFPPQLKENQLPPYSGDRYMEHHIGSNFMVRPNTREFTGVGEQVPGLPPYSVASHHTSAPYIYSANQSSLVAVSPTNQSVAYSVSIPASREEEITTASQTPMTSDTHRSSPQAVNTNPHHNLNSEQQINDMDPAQITNVSTSNNS